MPLGWGSEEERLYLASDPVLKEEMVTVASMFAHESQSISPPPMVSLKLRDLPINNRAGACTLPKQSPRVLKRTGERMVLALLLG